MGILRYEPEAQPNSEETIRLLYVSASRYEGDWNSIRHTHSFTELFYVTKGSGSFLAEGVRLPVSANDLVIINPQISHTETSLPSAPLEYITLGIEGVSFSFEKQANYALFHCKSLKNEFSFYFSALLKEQQQKKKDYQEICKNLLEILLIQLSRLQAQTFEIVALPRASQECSRVKRYIDANYGAELTLESLAAMAHLNKYYFSHSFSHTYGVSPISYLTSRRLKAAKELLQTTDYSVAEVARLSGFSSQSYFSQAFRKKYGITAGNCRKEKNKRLQSLE